MKADVALAEGSAGDDFGLEIVVLAEEELLAEIDFAAGANQALPIVWLGGKLAREQDLDAPVKKIAGGEIAAANGLGAKAGAASVKTSGKDAGVVENYNIVGAEQIGKVAKIAVVIFAGGALQVQHAGAVAGGERLLGDEFLGKMEVEIGNLHGFRLQEVRRGMADRVNVQI